MASSMIKGDNAASAFRVDILGVWCDRLGCGPQSAIDELGARRGWIHRPQGRGATRANQWEATERVATRGDGKEDEGCQPNDQ